ncbi:DUF1365 domain-containing protein [Falsiruegeria mediterranea]|jgi:uncharacterized protein|uniref:Cyclopropane-fatty-acyl-phospholipid synthase n=1 Tax=Falsiruegeria mediterranea M17 TaxID=1200281 RepID=A0A2R8CCF6_9RHOB|nr:DUF1365 domain-containing protein [Falsiruegeria mediterranea]SPJ30130.1 hypothetical protein TRM7615_03659 [Falsiruegeria mediterranea M17]
MTRWPDHIAGYTTHARRGEISNAFRYGVDFVLLDPEQNAGPALFSRNRFNLFAVHDRHHGGERGNGAGVIWAIEQFRKAGLNRPFSVHLLTQPTCLGYQFNPVSFWLAQDGDALIAVIAETNNTFGDRHSYMCHLPGFAAISAADTITAVKLMHVSPFQDVEGTYRFNFLVDSDRISIRIAHENGDQGVIATLMGARKPITSTSILAALARRPFGALRTISLIYWQALKLKLKGASYRPNPTPPEQETSACSMSANV